MMAAEQPVTTITAAQPIRRYQGPQWLVKQRGTAVTQDELGLFSDVLYTVLETSIVGWEPYNAIIRVAEVGSDYLVRIERAS